MARQEIDLTTPQPNGRMGEPTKTAWEKVNAMTAELYSYSGQRIFGNYADRPIASTVAGATYYAVDVKETYVSISGYWTPIESGGGILGYAEIVSPFSTSSTSLVDVPGLSVTCTVGERPILVFWGGNVAATSNLGSLFTLEVAGTQRAQMIYGREQYVGLGTTTPVSGLSPGSLVNFKLRMASGSSSANFILNGADNDRPFLIVRN